MEIGKKIKHFCLSDNNGKSHCLKDFADKWIILYFYPKDNTSGCTKEAIDFTELKTDFEDKNAVIIGISPDSEESHSKFIKKYDLGILLLSDTEKAIMRDFGAWGMKNNYGKMKEGVIRSTFIISPEHEIMYKWNNVKVQQKRKNGIVKHAETVLAKLVELQ
ncbi:MAG: peroxiredoxin [Bacteroidota bacterium]|nr:peroxiredoxin [Bacteroidota bacterium]